MWIPRLAALNTIISNAPLLIQGASRLIKVIKQQNDTQEEMNLDQSLSVESLHTEVQTLHERLNDNHATEIEQTQFIEQLAKQNESLAESLRQVLRRQMLLVILTTLAIISSVLALIVFISG